MEREERFQQRCEEQNNKQREWELKQQDLDSHLFEERPEHQPESALTLLSTTARDLLLRVRKYTTATLMHFDSMRGYHNSSKIYTELRRYLHFEWQHRHEKELGKREFNEYSMPGVSLGSPQQNNDCDCGAFLIHNAVTFIRRPFSD